MKKFIFLLLVPSIIFAQSIFVGKGTTCASVGYNYSADISSSNSGYGLVLALGGLVDFGISYSKLKCDNPKLDGKTFLSSISYLLRTEDISGVPGGISFSVGYLSSTITESVTYYPDGYGKLDRKIFGIIVGAAPTLSIYDNDKFVLFATLGLSYYTFSKNNMGNSNSTTVSFSIPFRYLKGALGFFVVPSISRSVDKGDQENIYGLTAGLLLNMKEK